MTDKKAQDRAKDKIRKLLALGTSDNPNEAKTAMRQAMALMKKHSLAEGDLRTSELTTLEFKSGFTKLPVWCGVLFNGIALSLGGFVVYQQGCGNGKSTVWVTGTKPVVEQSEYIYITAYRTIDKMAAKFRKDRIDLGYTVSASETNDYKRGCAISYINRVKEVYGTMEQELATEMGQALVPIDTRVKDAEAWYKEQNSQVKLRTNRKSARNSSALHQGKSDGSKVSVNQGVTGNTNRTLVLH